MEVLLVPPELSSDRCLAGVLFVYKNPRHRLRLRRHPAGIFDVSSERIQHFFN